MPAADVYRDVVASGGQVDVGFIPLWLGLVTGPGDPTRRHRDRPGVGLRRADRPPRRGRDLHLPLLLDAVTGGDSAYDGKFYRDRSPSRVIDRVTVPTFLVGGEFDIFQRGTPLLFENLQRRGVPTKMIIGPWDHLEGSSGADIGKAGHGTLDELQLRWFDRYVRGVKDPTLDKDIPPVTYYEQGSGRWTQGAALDGRPARRVVPALRHGDRRRWPRSADAGAAADGTAYVPPVPVSGLCTRSTNQWTAGLPEAALADLPCFQDNAANDQTGIVYETAPAGEGRRGCAGRSTPGSTPPASAATGCCRSRSPTWRPTAPSAG